MTNKKVKSIPFEELDLDQKIATVKNQLERLYEEKDKVKKKEAYSNLSPRANIVMDLIGNDLSIEDCFINIQDNQSEKYFMVKFYDYQEEGCFVSEDEIMNRIHDFCEDGHVVDEIIIVDVDNKKVCDVEVTTKYKIVARK